MPRKKKKSLIKAGGPFKLIAAIALILLVFDILPSFITNNNSLKLNLSFLIKPTPTPDPVQIGKDAAKIVLPDKVALGVSFKEYITKLANVGAIDKDKFLALYQNDAALYKEAQQFLSTPSNGELVINQKNSGLLLNLLWPLGLSNKTNVLSSGPMGQHYLNDVGSFASTGGWTIGKMTGGQLFNSLPVFSLTSDQEKEVSDIAQTIYRPCCGNSTYFPDCNHGAAMLGFLELAASQGMPKDMIYKKALALNSYWFPQTYVELAIYFKQNKNISWDKVDPKEALGLNYSSYQGYSDINKKLNSEGLVPKVNGGSSC